MNTKIFIAIIILFSSLNCIGELLPLNNQATTNHFYDNVKRVVEEQLGYQIRQDSDLQDDSFTLRLYNGNTFAATVSLNHETNYRAQSSRKAIISIQGVHSQKVTKYVYEYYESEMNMQFDVIPQLILRQGELEMDSNNNPVKNPFFLHLIEDVRMSIVENNRQHKLDFKIKFEEKNYSESWEDFQGSGMVETMILSSRETNLATIEVFITEVNDRSQNVFQRKNYIMNIAVKSIQNIENTPQIFQIPMISRNYEEFNAYMKHVNIFLDLDKYSNNNKENYLNLIKFLQEYFPKKRMQIKTQTDLEKQWNCIQFIIQMDKKSAQFELQYYPPHEELTMGEYQLKSTQDSQIKHDFRFQRMKNEDLINLYKKEKIQSLFQPIYDIVMELFVDKHEEIILNKYPNWVLADHKVENNFLTSIVSKNEYGYKADQKFIFICDTHSNSKKVELVYKALNLNGMKFTHQFPKNKFNMAAISNFIDSVLRNHLSFLGHFYQYQIHHYV